MTIFQNFLIFFGRLLFSFIFILGGIDKIMHFHVLVDGMTMVAYPMAELWVVVMLVFQLAAGILIFIGWKTRFGGLLAFISILLAQFMFHNYWTFSAQPMTGIQNFMWSNLALLGAALILIATGPGQISLDEFKNS